ncbi:MAG TPA: hypothetical protein VIJ58_04190 [Candidatus Dormibacteraeota bacterium]
MGFPRFPRRLSPAVILFGAAASASVLVAFAPTAHSHLLMGCTATDTSTCPPPTPTPVNAFLSLDVTAGPPSTQIAVNGSFFLPNEAMTLYWDQSNKVAGSAIADGTGNFTTHVKPFSGDAAGVHHLCASVPPIPCANFDLQAPTATATPDTSPSPSPDTSFSPTASPTPGSPSPTPLAAASTGFDLMLKPPFVILPIIAGLGLLIALGYWILSLVLRPRPQVLKSVAVAHLASRPDYAAAFGTPPPVPAEPAPQPSAWADVIPPTPAPPAPPAPSATLPEAPANPPPWAGTSSPSGEGDLPTVPDEPPDFPEPGG